MARARCSVKKAPSYRRLSIFSTSFCVSARADALERPESRVFAGPAGAGPRVRSPRARASRRLARVTRRGRVAATAFDARADPSAEAALRERGEVRIPSPRSRREMRRIPTFRLSTPSRRVARRREGARDMWKSVCRRSRPLADARARHRSRHRSSLDRAVSRRRASLRAGHAPMSGRRSSVPHVRRATRAKTEARADGSRRGTASGPPPDRLRTASGPRAHDVTLEEYCAIKRDAPSEVREKAVQKHHAACAARVAADAKVGALATHGQAVRYAASTGTKKTVFPTVEAALESLKARYVARVHACRGYPGYVPAGSVMRATTWTLKEAVTLGGGYSLTGFQVATRPGSSEKELFVRTATRRARNSVVARGTWSAATWVRGDVGEELQRWIPRDGADRIAMLARLLADATLYTSDPDKDEAASYVFRNRILLTLPAGVRRPMECGAGYDGFVSEHFDGFGGLTFLVSAYDTSARVDKFRDSSRYALKCNFAVCTSDGRSVDVAASELATVARWRLGVSDVDMVAAQAHRTGALQKTAPACFSRRHRGARAVGDVLGALAVGSGLQRAFVVVDGAAGSARTACEMLRTPEAIAAKNSGNPYVALAIDPNIERTACVEAWCDENVIFVAQRIEDVAAHRLPPRGLFRAMLAGPECSAVSKAARAKWKTKVTDVVVRVEHAFAMLETFGVCQAFGEFVRWVDCPSAFENPEGDDGNSLFNHTAPFDGFRYFLVIAAYCAYGTEYQKRSAFLANFSFILRQCRCRRASHAAVIGFTSKTGKRSATRGEVKVHPASLVRHFFAQSEALIELLANVRPWFDDVFWRKDDASRRALLARETDADSFGFAFKRRRDGDAVDLVEYDL